MNLHLHERTIVVQELSNRMAHQATEMDLILTAYEAFSLDTRDQVVVMFHREPPLTGCIDPVGEELLLQGLTEIRVVAGGQSALEWIPNSAPREMQVDSFKDHPDSLWKVSISIRPSLFIFRELCLDSKIHA
jgi:hypothetical protein